MSDTFTFKKSHLMIVAAILVIGLFGVFSVVAQGKSPTNNDGVTQNTVKAKSVNNGEFQEVKLTFKNYQYQLEPSTLIKDVPVRMEVDLDTVDGCMRDVVISSFGVRQYVKPGDNIIEFTPDKSGTFNIACSMNMGRGTFRVAESSGKVAEYQEAAPVGGAGSCGGGSAGGCGCGGA